MLILLILLGVVLLYAGGELLVKSVCKLATAFGVSPLIIGLTVVAFGTSSPEVAVVVGAGVEGREAIAFGNVVGSNIANLGLILAIAALIRPLDARDDFLRRDLPWAVVAGILLVPAAMTDLLGRPFAALLLVLFVGYMLILLRGHAIETIEEEVDTRHLLRVRVWSALGSVAGIALLIFGADVLVDASVTLARSFGVSERVIGLTMVAFGTSLPELAGSLVAVFRRQSELVLGNIIGSNIFNTLLVLPVGLLVRPMHVDPASWLDLGVMVLFALATFFMLRTQSKMTRAEGAVLLLGYVGYVTYLALA